MQRSSVLFCINQYNSLQTVNRRLAISNWWIKKGTTENRELLPFISHAHKGGLRGTASTCCWCLRGSASTCCGCIRGTVSTCCGCIRASASTCCGCIRESTCLSGLLMEVGCYSYPELSGFFSSD